MPKDVAKAKKQATHDFFPRSKSGTKEKKSASSSSFIFNKAPINKNDATHEIKTKVLAEQDDRDEEKRHGRNKATFLSKLYQDDDEFDELKVHGLIDEDDEEVNEARNTSTQASMAKRKSKALDKIVSKTKSKVGRENSKIGKLALRKDSLGMFAVCEIGKDYLIVNHTRNTKGYVPLQGSGFNSCDFHLGQLIVAMVSAEIGGAQTGQIYNFASGNAGLNRKVQLSLDSKYINKLLAADRVTKNMVLQAQVECKEAKGYILKLGFRDQTKGFLKSDASLKNGQMVTIIVKSVIATSKVVKCELLQKDNCEDCVQQATQESTLVADEFKLTAAHLKPGFMVSGKISKLFENGIEVTYLAGLTATCFVDHLPEDQAIADLKIGAKVSARIISVDPLSKHVTLSMKKHILNWTPDRRSLLLSKDIQIGASIENASVKKHLYGDSYIIDLGNSQTGFLHKVQMADTQPAENVSEDEDGAPPKKQADQREILQAGHELASVRVKEINYFDGLPVLSLKESVLKGDTLNYSMISPGQYHSAKIEKVNAEKKYITLTINEFVKGNLHIEHMADSAITFMPPKFQEVGKEIKVRVLSVDPSKRLIEFTKKDSLMKEDCPVFASYRDVKKGDKVICVVVSTCEHGLIVKTFGGIKGLLTFEDIKQKDKNYDEANYKVGTVIKAYCLFKKKDKGLALTLSKKKAKAEEEEAAAAKEGGHETIESAYLPSEHALESLMAESRFSTMIKSSKDSSLVGKVHKFRVIDCSQELNFYIAKSTDAEKKSKNFLALVPKCLVSSFSDFLTMSISTETHFSGLVLEIFRDSLPIVSMQPELIELRKEVPSRVQMSSEKLNPGATFVGVVNGLVGKAGQVSVRFLDGVSRSMKVKDLNTTKDYQKIYRPGKVIRVAVNKLERLCTKQKVVEACLAQANKSAETDKLYQAAAFAEQYKQSLSSIEGIKIGQQIEAEVQLVKDYGIIAQLSGVESSVKTGFILNDHKLNTKYKPGQILTCRVLDIDAVKKIADLKEIDSSKAPKSKEFKEGERSKAIVELNKEGYLVVALKGNRAALGICLNNNFNQDQESRETFEIGEEIEVKANQKSNSGFTQLIRVDKESTQKKSGGASNASTLAELKEGIRFTGQIKAIKQQCLYVQLPKSQANPKQTNIGRLHLIECQSNEFKTFAVGDRIECKILKVSEENERTWIELTRNDKHMAKLQGLDEAELKKSPSSLADMKQGQKYSAIVLSSAFDKEEPVNLKFSFPIQLQVSPFVRGCVPFNQIADSATLVKFGNVPQDYKVGQRLEATYIGGGNFSLLSQPLTKIGLSKGSLVTARVVKHIIGKGVTVQLSHNKEQHQFGFLPTCEITDDLSGNAVKYISDKSVFAARIIDFDAKGGKPVVSARESVVEEEGWKTIQPTGSSAAFQLADEQRMATGNLRNKILKYGADVALSRGDLAIGYVTNIGKAGCFVQIGHNCSVRAGLNELSDSASFDFATEFPVGRLVVGRIAKVEDTASGQKRFSYSTRQSLVVYGVGCVDRAKLAESDEVEALVMAVAEEKAFAQIKGSYIKLKVKNFPPKSIKAGDQIVASLTKVTKEKLSSTFVKKISKSDEITPEQKLVKSIYQSVEEEAARELDHLRAFNAEVAGGKSGAADFDAAHIDQKQFQGREEQLAQQIKDLEDLEKESVDPDAMEIDSNDSDAAEMKKLINYDKESGSDEENENVNPDLEDLSDDSEMPDFDDDDEEGEHEMSDEDMEAAGSDSEEDGDSNDSDPEDTGKKAVGKKRTLKDRMKEEQEIRAKEKSLRSGDYQPKDIDDFERLIVANQDQSYLWIQYIAFMLDNIGVEAARKIAERALKSISMTNETDKLNLWTAYMNLESNFGTQQTLEAVTKRALEVNDRKQVYLNLIDIYKSSKNFGYVEPIFKQLAKKFSNSLDIWSAYIEFLVDVRTNKKEVQLVSKNAEFSEPKVILQKALQALSKDQHVNMISKFGMLEFKSGNPEAGRTMFEGIVSNYPKRMDIWAIYMDMETKFGQGNATQARHLFERCLSNEHIQKKPKKMKLVFQKYMEYENKFGNKSNLPDLRKRVEEYLSKVFDQPNNSDENSD